MASQEWATSSLRQMVIQQIEDTYKNYGNPSNKTSQEVEKQIHDKAQSRDSYLQMVARLILHIKEVRGNQFNRQEGNSLGNVGNINNTHNNSAMGMIPNQVQNVNGLRNMQTNLRAQFAMGNPSIGKGMNPNQSLQVNRGIGPNIDMNNIQQLVNISRQNQTMNPVHSQGMITPNMIAGATVSATMTTSSYMSVPQQQSLQTQPMQQIPQQPQKVNDPNMLRKQMQLKKQMLNQQRTQQLHQQLLQQQLIQPPVSQQQPAPVSMSVQNPTQEFTMPSVKASNIPQQPSQPPIQQKSLISTSSPAKNISAPSPQPQQPVPSPMQPSPAYINPPSVGPSPSPLTQVEEQTYLEKLKEMSKYVEPLTRLITQMPKDEEHKRERDKMNGLLDTLTNKHRRVKLIVLHKCENVLSRLFPDAGSSGNAASATPDATIVDLLPTPIPKTSAGMPQMGEAVKNVMSSAHLMSEVRQNILPGMFALNAPMICPPTPPAMTSRKRSSTSKIGGKATKKSFVPRPLQMEVVRLLRKFIFSLDPAHPLDNAGVTLLCKSKEQDGLSGSLSVRVPTAYPRSEPTYTLYTSGLNVRATHIENLMSKKLLRLPHTVTFTSILTAWEQSVYESLVT